MARSNAQTIDRLRAQIAIRKAKRKHELAVARQEESQLLKAQRRERHQRRVEIGLLADEEGLIIEAQDHFGLLVSPDLVRQLFRVVASLAPMPGELKAWMEQASPGPGGVSWKGVGV